MKWNFYCLQVFFCILLFWVVVFNVILYFVLPNDPSVPAQVDFSSGLLKLLADVPASFALFLADPVLLSRILESGDLQTNELFDAPLSARLIFGSYKQRPKCADLEPFFAAAEFSCRSDDPESGNLKLVARDSGFEIQVIEFLSPETFTEILVAKSYISPKEWTLFEPFILQTVKVVSTTDSSSVSKFLVPGHLHLFLSDVEKKSRFLFCNQSSADRYFQTFPTQFEIQKQAEALKFRAVVRNILEKASVALSAVSVQFWLSSGTCLSWYRQCDVIPYMVDVDIGVWAEDYKPEIINALEEHGFQLKMKLGLVNDSLELSFVQKGVKLDVFFFYKELDYVWNGGTKPETAEKFRFIFPPFSLCWTVFLKLKARVPCETLAYITANYGENWFEPLTEWVWNKSPPNVRPNEQWTADLRNEAVQIFYTDYDEKE